MAIKYLFDKENNILYEKGEGKVTFNDFKDYRNQLSKTDLQSGLRCFADYRNALVDLSYDNMLQIIGETQNASKGIEDVKVAICASDDLGYGIARMYSAINETKEYNVNVFRTIEEACLFLGIANISKLDLE